MRSFILSQCRDLSFVSRDELNGSLRLKNDVKFCQDGIETLAKFTCKDLQNINDLLNLL